MLGAGVTHVAQGPCPAETTQPLSSERVTRVLAPLAAVLGRTVLRARRAVVVLWAHYLLLRFASLSSETSGACAAETCGFFDARTQVEARALVAPGSQGALLLAQTVRETFRTTAAASETLTAIQARA